MKDERKTKAELLAEIEQLRDRLAGEAGDQAELRQPTLSQDMSRRSALKIAWVAPVVLSVPIANVVGRPQKAVAGTTPKPTAMPTLMPTMMPTRMPTGYPTLMPTGYPTRVPELAPTKMPTMFGPGGPNAPTVFQPAADAPVLSNAAAAAAAGALFGFGVKKLLGEPEDEGGD